MWVAALSNHLTYGEEETPQGEQTAWRKLLSDLRETDHTVIEDLKLRVRDTVVSCLPPNECDGYFQAYQKISFIQSHKERNMQGIGYVLGDKVHITWLEDVLEGPVIVWQDVRDLDSCRVHTILHKEE